MSTLLRAKPRILRIYQEIQRRAGPIRIARNRDARPWQEFEVHALDEPASRRVIGSGRDRFEALDDAQANMRVRAARDIEESRGDYLRGQHKEADLRGWP